MQKNALARQPERLPDWLRQVPYSEIREAWKEAIPHPDDLDQVARVCWVDRFFLLTQILHREDLWHPWIYERCRMVENDPDGFIDIWARGHGKSSLITLGGSIQEILRNPEITIGLFSHTSSVAKAFLSQIKREFESNTDLKQLFPDVLYSDPAAQPPSWSVDNGLIVRRKGNPKEATIEAHGLVDGQPTSRHFSLLIYDDVVTEKSVSTADQILKTAEAFSLSDNLGGREARRWIIGTRYHFSDAYATIIERGTAKLRKYPATDDGTLDGNPVFLSRPEWEAKKRDQLESTVACQLLADPQAGNQRFFDVNDIPYYEVRPERLMVYLMVDPAHSLKRDSDDSAYVVIGIDAGWNRFLLDGIAHKMDLAQKWRWLRDLWRNGDMNPGCWVCMWDTRNMGRFLTWITSASRWSEREFTSK